MNTTIAVALIAALAALMGAITTGYLGLIVNRAQIRTQQSTGEIERNEKHEQYLRESRRNAYLAFIGQLRQIEEVFDRDLWIRTGFGEKKAISPEEIMYTATASFVQLESQLDLILLEGPQEVSKAAHDVFATLQKESFTLMTLQDQGKAELSLSHADMYKIWKKMAQDRKKAKAEFIKSARNALSG